MKDLENHKTFKVIWTEIFCKYSNDLNLFPKERFHQQHIQFVHYIFYLILMKFL